MTTPFSDDGQIPEWGRDEIEWAIANGIVRGDAGTNRLGPLDTPTKTGLAVMLHRYAAFAGDLDPNPDPDPEPDPDPDPEPDPDPDPDPEPDPDPDPIPVPTGGNIAFWLPAGFTPRVELPRGILGADPGTADTIVANLLGGAKNKIIMVPRDLSSGHVLQDGLYENCTIHNPMGHPVNSFAKNATLVQCVLDGVSGDGLKAGAGDRVRAIDTVITMAPGHLLVPFGPGAKHYDGAQAHADGEIDMERVLVDWNGIGATSQSTGLIFTQDQASLRAHHVTMLDPGGTRSSARLYGSGAHDCDNWHFWGVRERNQNWDKDYPRELVMHRPGIARFTVFNDVQGADTFREDRS